MFQLKIKFHVNRNVYDCSIVFSPSFKQHTLRMVLYTESAFKQQYTPLSYLFCVVSVASLTCVMENHCRSVQTCLFRWFWRHWLALWLWLKPSSALPINPPTIFYPRVSIHIWTLRYEREVIKTLSCSKLSAKGARGKSEVGAVYCIQISSKIELETSKETHSKMAQVIKCLNTFSTTDQNQTS